jgi:hypothetical protein
MSMNIDGMTTAKEFNRIMAEHEGRFRLAPPRRRVRHPQGWTLIQIEDGQEVDIVHEYEAASEREAVRLAAYFVAGVWHGEMPYRLAGHMAKNNAEIERALDEAGALGPTGIN